MSVSRIGEFTGKPERIEELKEFLFSVMPVIESSQGCELVQLYQSKEDPTRFTMIEVWDSVESHRASVKNIPSAMLAQIQPLLGSAPQGGYYELIADPTKG